MSDLIKELHEQAEELFKATAEKLPVEVGCEVRIAPGGLATVHYRASCGDVLGEGIRDRKYATGTSPEAAVSELILKIDKGEIAKKIRMHHLEKMAKDLGMVVSPLHKEGGEQ